MKKRINIKKMESNDNNEVVFKNKKKKYKI
jgi:hypothetical protein